MSKYRQMAGLILDAVGGRQNIAAYTNCMTRLRITTISAMLVDRAAIKKIEGVLGVVDEQTFQIILGPGVVTKVAEQFGLLLAAPGAVAVTAEQLQQTGAAMKAARNKSNDTPVKNFLRKIGNIFIPLIPAFVGAGLIAGIGSVLANNITAGNLDGAAWQQYLTILNVIKNAIFSYLVIYVGINAAREFGASAALGGAIGGVTMLSGMAPTAPIYNVFTGETLAAGQGGVFGVLLAVWLLAFIEKRLRKVIPDAVDIIVTPTIALLAVGLVTIFFIMPLAGFVSDHLIGAINWVLVRGGAFAGFVLGIGFLPLVMFGLHQVLTPIHIEMINSTGMTQLLPVLAMAGAGQVGAAGALWVRCRKNKSLTNMIKGALPVGILGIGEPLIYGVTLPLGRPFITACIGGGCGGAMIGFLGQIGAIAIGPSGMALIPLIAGGAWANYAAGLLTAYAGGFVATYLFGIPPEAMKEQA